MREEDYDNYINCVSCGTKYEKTREECPKCAVGNYRYDRFLDNSGSGSGSSSANSEKEIDNILAALDNYNRRKILKFLLQGEKSRREIADELDVALEAATRHCDQLISIGVISEVGRPNPERGGFITKYFLNVERLLEVLKKISTNVVPQVMERTITKTQTLDISDDSQKEISLFAKDMSSNLQNVPWIIIDSGDYDGKAFPLKNSSITIGRDTKAGIPVPIDPYISGIHAEIYYIDNKQGQKYMLRDLKSRNHTTINDRILANEEIEIRNGDRFKIGKTWLKFMIPN